jgi:hypothetical protein
MNRIAVFLADVPPGDVLASWRLSDPAIRERFIIFGSITLVTLAVLLWAAFIRKTRRRHSRHHHHHHHRHTPSPNEAPAVPQTEDAADWPEKRRRRRRHHHHRPRNPTLAETGGLPPIRPESPPDAEP